MESAWFIVAYILFGAVLFGRNYIFLFRGCSVRFALQTYYCDWEYSKCVCLNISSSAL